MEEKFNLGKIVMTCGSMALDYNEVEKCLAKFKTGDWGNVPESDRLLNDEAVLEKGQIIDSYYDEIKKKKFWIITDDGHETTTVLLPEEY